MLRVLVAILLLAAVPVLPAGAQGKSQGKGRGKGAPAERGSGGDRYDRYDEDRGRDRDDWRRFDDSDRRWWQDYWRDEYARGHCPPGLARKHNGCLPPGLAKKRYAIGRPLPGDLVILAVPGSLLGRLPPLEPGYRYGMVDGDLLKLAVGTGLVVDAIDGLWR
jgi:hypothetical protein